MGKTMRAQFAILVLLFALTGLVVAQSSDPATVAVSTDVECWNPLEGPCGASIKYHDLVMETLLNWDRDLELSPGLATSWEAIDDLTWEFKLREGVEFTNGEPFNADAVVFMFDAILNPEGRDAPTTQQASYRPLERIEVIDDHTVRFITSEPYPLLPRYMAFEPRAVPPAYYAEVGAEQFGARPIGTGPFKLTEWVRNEHFDLESNENYWAGAPEVQQLRFRPIPEDTTRVAELASGGVDIAENIPGDQMPLLEGRQGVHLETIPGLDCVYVNLRPEDRIQDQALREAFMYATNYDEIVSDLLGGLADPLRQGNCVTPYEFGYDESIEPWPYDLERARQALEDAGYQGHEIVLYYPEGEVPQVDQLAQVLQAQWAEAGLNVSVHKMEYGLWRQNWSARTVPGDIYLKTSAAKAMDSDARLVPSVHCRDDESGMGRVSFYCNPQIDELIERARVTVDADARQEMYTQAWAMHRDDAHHLTLYSPRVVYGISDQIDWIPTIEGFWGSLAEAELAE